MAFVYCILDTILYVKRFFELLIFSLSHLNWTIFIAFIAHCRAKAYADKGGFPAPLMTSPARHAFIRSGRPQGILFMIKHSILQRFRLNWFSAFKNGYNGPERRLPVHLQEAPKLSKECGEDFCHPGGWLAKK